VIGLVAAGVLAPFFFEVTPEVRSTYQSLGKIVEDRPMQVTSVRFGYDTGSFGRFGIRNWDVSSLTDRRHDAHRNALYHTEFGAMWQYDIDIADEWRLKSDLARSWTLYRGFSNKSGNKSYQWYQIDQSVENPYLVPFWRVRKCFRGNDYLYFRAGVRKRFGGRGKRDPPGGFLDSLYVTPSLFFDGGSSRNQKRIFGEKRGGGDWREGASAVSFRLELGWLINDNLSAFAYVEQYEVVGGDERRTNRASSYRCAHNDWTHGGFGVKLKF